MTPFQGTLPSFSITIQPGVGIPEGSLAKSVGDAMKGLVGRDGSPVSANEPGILLRGVSHGMNEAGLECKGSGRIMIGSKGEGDTITCTESGLEE
jgi:hypothetical protein